MNKVSAVGFAILVPIMSAIGGYYGTVVTPLILIVSIAACIILVALGKIRGNLVYFYIFGMSLGLLYQTTMMGVDVVGSDIHNELYYARLNFTQGWDYTIGATDNASFVIWFIVPMFAKLLHIDVLWVIKAILPIFLAIVPLVLYSVFKRQFGDLRAFFAVIFFMIIPVFSMEIASIAKSMVAELFFALMVWVVVSGWKWQYKAIGICITLIMQIVCHYTVGVLGIGFLCGMLGIRIFALPLRWRLFSDKKTPIWVLVFCLIIGAGSFLGYHGVTAKGAMANNVIGLISQYIPFVQVGYKHDVTIVNPSEINTPGLSKSFFPIADPEFKNERPSALNAAIGIDFMAVPIEGKIFRIVQFLTQLMIIIGVIKLAFFNKYEVTAEFVGFIGASAILLLCCLLLTRFADLINMTRFYHFSLFFLAPVFVIGCEAISDIWATCFGRPQ